MRPLNKDNFSPVLYCEVDEITFCKNKGSGTPEEYLFNMLQLLGSKREWMDYEVAHQTATSVKFHYAKDGRWLDL